MFWQEKYMLPASPPDHEMHVDISSEMLPRMQDRVDSLSAALNGVPLILSQAGDVLCAAGLPDESESVHFARRIDRMWKDFPDSFARELLRFDLEEVENEAGLIRFRIYSRHITGALTMTIGWQEDVSLTQIRAEATDLKDDLLEMLR